MPGRPSSGLKTEAADRPLPSLPPLAERPGLKDLFLGFSSVSLSGFGGVLPFARHMLVDKRRWMTAEEFNTQLGLCQFVPGPNIVNLAVLVGKRQRGAAGAVVAALGLLLGPFLLVLLLGLAYDTWGDIPQVQGMLRGIAAAGCGLLFAMAWRMGAALRDKRFFLPFAALTVLCIAGLRWPMPAVMLGGLLLTSGLAWWRLGKAKPR